MDGIEPQAFLFAALFVGVGVTTMLRRNLTLGWDDEDSKREINGNAAIALGFAMVTAGVGALVNQTFGFIMFVVVWAYASIVARR